MSIFKTIIFLITISSISAIAQADSKKKRLAVDKVKSGLSVMVLGSGGPVATSDRVSAGYLIFIDGQPRILMDAGGGVFQRIGKSGAKIGGLESILFSHLHMDHTGGMTPILAMSFFHNMAAGVQRDAAYNFIGPTENEITPFPSTSGYIDGHFLAGEGLERYIAGFPRALNIGTFNYEVQSVSADTDDPMSVVSHSSDGVVIKAIAVNHGRTPSLAYRIEYKGKSIVYSGDTTSKTQNMITLAQDADLVIYDTAILDDSPAPFINAHTTPTRIGEVAVASGAKAVLLTHITGITEPNLDLVKHTIREQGFNGRLKVAHDLDVINLHKH